MRSSSTSSRRMAWGVGGPAAGVSRAERASAPARHAEGVAEREVDDGAVQLAVQRLDPADAELQRERGAERAGGVGHRLHDRAAAAGDAAAPGRAAEQLGAELPA